MCCFGMVCFVIVVRLCVVWSSIVVFVMRLFRVNGRLLMVGFVFLVLELFRGFMD